MLLDSFYHAKQVRKTAWMVDGKGSEICFGQNKLNHNGAKMIDFIIIDLFQFGLWYVVYKIQILSKY